MWMPTGNAAASSSSTRCMGGLGSRALPAERRSAGSWWGNAGRTIVRSASEVEHLIGDERGGFHFQYVVDSDDVRTAQDGGGDGGGGGALQEPGRSIFRFRKERFARRADDQRKLERGKGREAREDFGVLLLAFAEAQPGIDGDARAVHSSAHGAMRRGIQILRDGPDDVFDGRELGPGFRST